MAVKRCGLWWAREQERALARFRALWEELARHNEADDIDGAEYRRVFAAWCVAGWPEWSSDHIRRLANQLPPGPMTS